MNQGISSMPSLLYDMVGEVSCGTMTSCAFGTSMSVGLSPFSSESLPEV